MDGLTFSADDIKAIDGITLNRNILPSAGGSPRFANNPYTINNESGITVQSCSKLSCE